MDYAGGVARVRHASIGNYMPSGARLGNVSNIYETFF